MTTVRMRGAAAALALLTALALAGCGDDEVDQAAGAGSGSGGSSTASDADGDPNDESDADAVEADVEVVDDEVVDDEEALVGEACLYGNWILDNESFKTMLEQAGGDVRSVEGLVMVSYRQDGTTTASFHEWTTVAVQDQGEATMVRNGHDLGTYTVSGDTLATTETAGDSVLTMTMVVDGQTITANAPHEQFSSSTATFTCTAEKLTVTAEGATTELGREH